MSIKLGRELDISNFTKTERQNRKTELIGSEQKLPENSKEILNKRILSIITELNQLKRIYIADSANRVRKEYENLARLLSQLSSKHEKCKLLLKNLNSVDAADTSIIQSILIKSDQEVSDWLEKYTDVITLYDIKYGISNLKYSEYKALEASEIEHLKNNINNLIDFDNETIDQYEKIRCANGESYKQIVSDYYRYHYDWKKIKNTYKKTSESYKTKIKYKILLQLSINIENLYQYYTKMFNQVSNKFKKLSEILNQDTHAKNYDDHIYLGDSSGITKFSLYPSRQEYHYLDYQYSCSSWIIKLSGDKLLCCGHREVRKCLFSKPSIANYLFVINSKTFQFIRNVPDLKNIERCNGTYYKDNVYLFGNLSDSDDRNGYSFNLKKWEWKKLMQLPMKSSNCSCIPFKKSILLCGFTHDNLYKYDIDIENYSKIDLSLKKHTIKLLFYSCKKVYVIEFGGFIYESEFENEYSWAQVGEGCKSGPVSQIYWYASDSIVSFGTSDKYEHEDNNSFKFYQFQLEKKKLIEVKYKI